MQDFVDTLGEDRAAADAGNLQDRVLTPSVSLRLAIEASQPGANELRHARLRSKGILPELVV
jgi:hypothetical protein